MKPVLYEAVRLACRPEVRPQVSAAQVINAHGAFQRIRAEGRELIEQLPAFTAPYGKLWLELGQLATGQFTHHAGILINQQDVRDRREPVAQIIRQQLNAQGTDVGWHLAMHIVIDRVPLVVYENYGRVDMMLTEQGRLVQLVNIDTMDTRIMETRVSPEIEKAFLRDAKWFKTAVPGVDVQKATNELIIDIAYAALLVLGMLHCKNVELAEPVVSAKIMRHRRKHGKSETRYWNIKVTGKGARSGSDALRVPSGSRNAMHWCRGHFRTYTDDAPLFGRITGTFWVDPHMRGNRGEGQVEKTYTIDAEMPMPIANEGAEV